MRIVWDQFPFLVFQPESQPENALENTIFPGRTKCTECPKQVHRAAIHPSLLNASASGIPLELVKFVPLLYPLRDECPAEDAVKHVAYSNER